MFIKFETLIWKVGERESDGGQLKEENEKQTEEVKDVEKGEVGSEERGIESSKSGKFQFTSLQRLNPTNPLRNVLNGGTRVATPSTSHFPEPPHPSQLAQPQSIPTPQVSSFL